MSLTKSFWGLRVCLVVSPLSYLMMGCFYGFQHTDILTNRLEYWGGFPKDQVYEFVQAAFCLQDPFHFGPFLSDHYYSEKSSRMFRPNEYEEAGANEGIAIVSSGTRIRRCKLVGHRGGGLSQISAYGVILDGPLAGKEIDFGDLAEAGASLPRSSAYNSTLKPRTEFFKVVSPTDRTTAPK